MTTRPPAWKVWLTAARPRTLTATLAPVLLGLAAAWGGCARLDLVNALATLVGALGIQIGTNFFNDYADSRTGADSERRLGPPRATSLGWVTPRAMLVATAAAFLVATLAGLVLIARCGLVFFWIGLSSLICGVWYTAGRKSLAYLGLAEPFVLVFFGPVAVAGTAYAQCGRWLPDALILGLGPGALSTILLVLNNMRDREGDDAAGKKTLVVRFGKHFGLGEIFGCLLVAAAAPPLAGWLSGSLVGIRPPMLLPAIFIAVAAPLALRAAHRAEGRDFNALMARTGQMLMIYAVLSLPGLLLR